ncbi:MAG: pantetheine-phosphate adenylyltransferase [Deltaproteobacteria bacterium]|nr:pantetheine-phosphate adenylyltransferase [Deltaproteobacteria bacterium]
MSIALYPGSFDPPTNGHLSLVERGLAVFDKIIVSVVANPAKSTALFSLDERLELLKGSLAHLPQDRLTLSTFSGLTIEYARQAGAAAILRGLRGSADFEYERQLAEINRHLAQDVQTVFLMADYKWFFISSSTVKEAASLGADVDGLVPKIVAEGLKKKFGVNK